MNEARNGRTEAARSRAFIKRFVICSDRQMRFADREVSVDKADCIVARSQSARSYDIGTTCIDSRGACSCESERAREHGLIFTRYKPTITHGEWTEDCPIVGFNESIDSN